MVHNEGLIHFLEQALVKLLDYRIEARLERAATCEGFPEWYQKTGEIQACEKIIWLLIGLKRAQSTAAVLEGIVQFDLDLGPRSAGESLR